MWPVMRLDRFVCKSTKLTKSEATQLINEGRVLVNGDSVINEAIQVHENNTITLNDKWLKPRAFRYILMDKPANTISSNTDEFYPSLFNAIDVENVSELHIAGRLDADTTGLVLITDDGRWSYNITKPTKHCEKVYRVSLSRPVADNVVCKFVQGIKLQGETQLTLPAKLTIVSPKEVLLTITEGKFIRLNVCFRLLEIVLLHYIVKELAHYR